MCTGILTAGYLRGIYKMYMYTKIPQYSAALYCRILVYIVQNLMSPSVFGQCACICFGHFHCIRSHGLSTDLCISSDVNVYNYVCININKTDTSINIIVYKQLNVCFG